MPPEKKTTYTALFILCVFLLGAVLFINLPAIQGNFLFADEAIYFSMTQSLAQDGDLEYTRKDLIRYYKTFDAGPLGIFLKKAKDGKIFYAKSFAYSLFTAPFAKVFGCNGHLVFHVLLLLLLLLMGTTYFSLENPPTLALMIPITFLFTSVAVVYIIWITPDFFNFFLVFTALFLWIYKHRYRQKDMEEAMPSRGLRFLLSDGSDYLACAIAAVAVFSKPPNIVLMGPLLLHTLWRKKPLKAVFMLLIFLAVSGAFWGTNQLITGEWNYQGGERKTFYGPRYPLETEALTFDSVKGGKMSSEGYTEKHLLPARVVIYNLFYYFFGRFTGIAWYFFPALLGLILFFRRRRSPAQWMILAALAGEILIFIVLMPDNYSGGGGALANRYFLNIFPYFFFLPALRFRPRELGFSWIWAAVFIAPILISPFHHSHYPATHVKKFPYTHLPAELTLVNNFPTNTNPWARRQSFGVENSWLHFLDDNFHPKLEPTGFWTRGDKTASMILKTYYPVKKLDFSLLNNPRMQNEITVQVGHRKQRITLGTKQRGTLSFTPLKPFKIKAIHLYRIKIKASKGSIPYYESMGSREKRHLGVFFEIKITPEN